MKKTIAFLLALVMVICCLSACGTSQGSKKNDADKPSINAKFAYKADYVSVKLPENMDSLDDFTQVGSRLFASCSVNTDVEENPNDSASSSYTTSASALVEISMEDGSVTVLDWYQPQQPKEGFQGNSYISLMRTDAAGNLWIADNVNSFRYDLPANFDPETQDIYEYYEDGGNTRRICCYSPDGTVLNDAPLSAEAEQWNLVCIDEKSQLYFTDWEKAYVLSAEGKTLKTIPLDQASLIDFCGKPALESYGDNQTLRPIDPDTFELGENIDRPVNAWSTQSSNREQYDYYYDYSGCIYGHTAAGESELVVDWMDLDVDSNNINNTLALTDGRFIGIYRDYNSDNTDLQLIVLTEVDPSTLAQKTSLTLACMYLDYNLRSQIVAFNKASDSVHIVISDYSQYSTTDDYNAGITKLNTEIMAGQIPDLFVVSQLPMEQYIAAGVIEPLNGFFEKETEFTLDSLVPQVRDAASVDGKLYMAYPSFQVDTVIALKRIADQYDAWTPEAVDDALSQLQDNASIFSVGYTQSDVLRSCVNRSIAKFVDWNTGKCSFDSPEFKSLLSFTAKFPTEFDWDNFDWSDYRDSYSALRNGQQLMNPTVVYSIDDYLWMLAAIHEDFTFVGYPSTDGSGSSFNINNAICMSSTCTDKDAGWSFLRTFFTEEYQQKQMEYGNGFPSNQSVFDKLLEKEMTVEYQKDADGEFVLDDNGEKIVEPKVSYYVDDATQYTIDALSQEQADLLLDLIASTKTVSSSNDAIFDIIQEETGAFFEGQRSVDDVCAMIQNRVGLYVAEQKK